MESKKLTIFFTSDLHAYIYPTDYRSREERDIGLFKCASRFTRDGNTLIIDGGDLLQGSPLGAFCHDTLQNAAPFAEMMNCCGYDYVTLGNHDFNYGMPYLESYLNALRARCVCQNIRWDGAGVRFPACIHTLENGLRIGIVGIVTDYVNIWERPEHLRSHSSSRRGTGRAPRQNRPQPLRLSRWVRAGSYHRPGAFLHPRKCRLPHLSRARF